MFEYKTVSATTHKREKFGSDEPWNFYGIASVLNKYAEEGYEHYHTVFVEKGAQIDEISGVPAVILHLRRIKKE